MKKLNLTYIIIAVIIGISILGFGVLNYISGEKNRELEMMKLQQSQEQAAQQQLQAKQQQENNKEALNNCLLTADTNYSENWFQECKSEGKLTDYCISLHSMTAEQYAKQNNIPTSSALSKFLQAQNDCSCRLAQYNADSINQTLQNDKTECFKEYPQN